MKKDEISKQLEEIKSLIQKNQDKLFNLVEAANYLSMSQSHLYHLTSKAKIPFHKPAGKYLYFYKSELDEWVRTKNVKT